MTTEARMNEPSPIRGRWTVTICDECGEQLQRGWQQHQIFPQHGIGRGVIHKGTHPVEVVPVPDEQAIERAAKAMWEANARVVPLARYRSLFRLGLAAALEQPE
jgi:hypothetical protein